MISEEAALTATINKFYQAMTSTRIGMLFENTDLDALRENQFHCMLHTFSEGQTGYGAGRQIGVARRRLLRESGLNKTDFDHITKDLKFIFHKHDQVVGP